MVNSLLVGCGQRIVWGATQAIRATSLMSGVPNSSLADGHARQKHHRIHAVPRSVRGRGLVLTVKLMRSTFHASDRYSTTLILTGKNFSMSDAFARE